MADEVVAEAQATGKAQWHRWKADANSLERAKECFKRATEKAHEAALLVHILKGLQFSII